ncbi:hypothetical protein SeMB42_g01405 [Synchytrium endobioticum]|uniref:Uncharacterized protein n=1 Tax=Synchytrium endobioticum TaxID=286115 RepID=A0A507DLA6_9FUNG|nr:hypothetical protein SeLEV6574_g01018 [Synchytrium endobioticum]TPX52479.1 hypothetical protein SeMB42_g01405 [Synchytrium endobioticum]
MSDTINESGYPETYPKCIEDIREAGNDFRTIDIPAMNSIGKFDERDHQTWVDHLVRTRAVYHFVKEIGELLNRLHLKRNID